ncbi:MAG: hypothetical protein EZS28_044369, partial [Streblomastix strix]
VVKWKRNGCYNSWEELGDLRTYVLGNLQPNNEFYAATSKLSSSSAPTPTRKIPREQPEQSRGEEYESVAEAIIIKITASVADMIKKKNAFKLENAFKVENEGISVLCVPLVSSSIQPAASVQVPQVNLNQLESLQSTSRELERSHRMTSCMQKMEVSIRARRKSRIAPDFSGFQNLRHGQFRQNVTRGCSGLSVISIRDQPFFSLVLSSSSFNPLKNRSRPDFEAELVKYKWMKQSVWKTAETKQKSDDEHSELYAKLMKTLIAAQGTTLNAIHSYLGNEPIGLLLLHIYKLLIWATDDGQKIKQKITVHNSDKDIVDGVTSPQDVRSDDSKKRIEEKYKAKLLENVQSLIMLITQQQQQQQRNNLNGGNRSRWQNHKGKPIKCLMFGDQRPDCSSEPKSDCIVSSSVNVP